MLNMLAQFSKTVEWITQFSDIDILCSGGSAKQNLVCILTQTQYIHSVPSNNGANSQECFLKHDENI